MYRYLHSIAKDGGASAVAHVFFSIPENKQYEKYYYTYYAIGDPITRNGNQYKYNTKMKVKRDYDFNYNKHTYLLYNRVDIGILFKGLKVNAVSLAKFEVADVDAFFSRAWLYVSGHVDYELVENASIKGFWMRAKPESFIFIGEVFIEIVDRRKDIQSVVTMNTITFAPGGTLWCDPEQAGEDMQDKKGINDLRFATAWLGISKADLEEYDSDIIDKYEYLNRIAKQPFKDQIEEYGLFVTELLKRFHNIDAWGYVTDTSNGFDGEINIAECEVLYNGDIDSDEAKQYINTKMLLLYNKVLVFKPLKTHKYYGDAFTRFATIYYS